MTITDTTIFEKAIAGSHHYDVDIRAMTLEGKGTAVIYEALSQRDVRSADDAFRPRPSSQLSLWRH